MAWISSVMLSGLATTSSMPTANAMSHHTEEYLAVGMDEVVAKPLNITELIHAIERVRQKAEDAVLLAETALVRGPAKGRA